MSTAPSIKGDLLRFSLEIVKGPHAGTVLEFDRASVTMGRGAENDVVLSADPRVSRQHAELKQTMGQFYLVNLSQKNFVLVNGVNAGGERIETKSRIQLGETEMVFTVQGGTNFLEPVQPGSFSMRQPGAAAPARPPAAVAETTSTGLRPRAGTAVPFNNAGPLAQGAPAQPPGPVSGAPPAYNEWAAPPSGPSRPYPMPAGPGLMGNKRVRIYGTIALVGALFFFMMKGGRQQRVDDKPFRTAEELSLSRIESENEIKAFQERRERMQSTVYQEASKNFLRGYRDYRQGQYARAREAFQVVLNLDPENELAKRYYNLSKIRFDEQVKFNMLQGRRYLETQNYRLCRASFKTVMTMLGGDQSNPEYKEALTLHRQCDVAVESRY